MRPSLRVMVRIMGSGHTRQTPCPNRGTWSSGGSQRGSWGSSVLTSAVSVRAGGTGQSRNRDRPSCRGRLLRSPRCRRSDASGAPASWTPFVFRSFGYFADAIRAWLIELALRDVRRVELDHRSSRNSDWYTTESTGIFDRLLSLPLGWGEAARSRRRQTAEALPRDDRDR
jgi:hypothetical protein